MFINRIHVLPTNEIVPLIKLQEVLTEQVQYWLVAVSEYNFGVGLLNRVPISPRYLPIFSGGCST